MKMLRGVITALREAWRLAKPYFRSEEKWRAFGLLAVVMLLNLIVVYGQVLNTYWFKYAYNALQQKNASAFWKLAVTYMHVPEFPYWIPGFLGIGVLLTVASTYATYLQQLLQIRWWQWLTRNFVNDWMGGRAYYQLALRGDSDSTVDNPDQRIANDLNNFVGNNLNLSISFITNLFSLGSYVGILWSASAAMTMFGSHIPGYLVWAALLYSGFGTLFAHLIGRRLIKLNFLQQRFEADLRFNLVRIRENTEQIALYGGERQETSGVMNRFQAIYLNWWQIMKRTKMFNFFTLGFSNFAVFVALIVAAPDYFSGVISLGVLMLINSSFGNVQNSFSWIIGSYQQIVSWRATVQRLDGFERAVAEAHRRSDNPGVVATQEGDRVRADALSIDLPDGSSLFSESGFEIDRGTPLAIVGPSGTGKSTLLRMLAGIWPFGRGRISRPAGKLMFMPQKPYFPIGSVKQAVTYPRPVYEVADDAVREVLEAVGLGRLGDKLETIDNWTLRLSGGEQQRLAIARVLLIRPDWLFLDESLSSLDPPAARSLFETLQKRLPQTQIVSVAHDATLVDLHPRRAALRHDEDGAIRLDAAAPVPGE